MLTFILVALESITRPRANIPAKMMPMDVSSLMPVRRLNGTHQQGYQDSGRHCCEEGADSQQECYHHSRQHRVGKGIHP